MSVFFFFFATQLLQSITDPIISMKFNSEGDLQVVSKPCTSHFGAAVWRNPNHVFPLNKLIRSERLCQSVF